MINLRYHIVSLIAVFLALGVGVLVGTTVIDKVTVEALDSRLRRVQRSVGVIDAENRTLKSQVAVGREFADRTRELVVRDHLTDVAVLVLAVSGIDRKPVEGLGQSLRSAGALVEGTVWFTARMRLVAEADQRALATAVAVPTEEVLAPTSLPLADELRARAIARLGEPGVVAALVAANFATYESGPVPPPGGSGQPGTPPLPGLDALPVAGTRFVIASGAGAEVGDDLLALPMAASLADRPVRLVAVEAGQDSPGGRAVFVGPLRSDGRVSSRLSTVDNLDSPIGQAATVLALEELGASRVGHFGVGPGAQRLLP